MMFRWGVTEKSTIREKGLS